MRSPKSLTPHTPHRTYFFEALKEQDDNDDGIDDPSSPQRKSTLIFERLKNSDQITNKFYYYITLIYFAVDDFTASNCLITLPNMIAIYGDVFNLDVPGMNIFNLYFLALYGAGYIIGGLFNYKLGIFGNTSYSRFFIRIGFALCFFLALIKNEHLFLGLRLVQGICIGILAPCSLGDLFRLSPPNIKALAGSVISFSFTTGMTIGMLLTYFESLGWYSWKVIYIFVGSVQVLALLINLLVHKIDLSFEQSLQKGDKDKAVEILSRYLKQESIDWMIEEEEKYIALTNQSGTNQSLIVVYYREFLLVTAVLIGLGLNFSSLYSSYMMLLVCKNLEDKEEVRVSTLYLTVACGIEFFVKIGPLLYPKLTDNRKQTMMRGAVLVAILWALMCFFYYNDDWHSQKLLAIVWMAVIGYFIYPPFFCLASDMVTGELMGVVFSVYKIVEILIQSLFSLAFPKQRAEELYWKASVLFTGTSVILIFLLNKYLFETSGLTKTHIHDILIGKRSKPAS